VTSLGRDGVRLPFVLGHTGVDRLHNIGTDRRLEDIGERGGGSAGLSIGTDDRNSGSGRLFRKIRQHFTLLLGTVDIPPFFVGCDVDRGGWCWRAAGKVSWRCYFARVAIVEFLLTVMPTARFLP